MKKAPSRLGKNLVAKISIFSEKNSFILFLIFVVFFLRTPFLFEPLSNQRDGLLLATTNGLLPNFNTDLFSQISIAFVKISFWLWGSSFWSVKFSITLYLLINLFIFHKISKDYFGKKQLHYFLVFLSFLLVLPFLFNGLNFLTLIFLPILSSSVVVLKKFFPKATLVPLFSLILISLIFCFFIFNRQLNLNYYGNFIHYVSAKITNQKNPEETYYQSFGKQVPVTYTLAAFLNAKTKKTDKIFLFGDFPGIYFLANRKAASSNFSFDNPNPALFEDLAENKPVYLLVDINQVRDPKLDKLIKESYTPFDSSSSSGSTTENLTTQTENVILYKIKNN